MMPSAETAPAADPLAHIAAALFQPMDADGVYARTALYEGVIERLGAFISAQRAADKAV